MLPMQQDTRRTHRAEMTRAAPTDPAAFLLWSSQRRREEGKFELSRGRVVCNMIFASRGHAEICANIIIELGRQLDREVFAVSSADFAVQSRFGVRSPDVVVDLKVPDRRELATSTPIFIAVEYGCARSERQSGRPLQVHNHIGTAHTE